MGRFENEEVHLGIAEKMSDSVPFISYSWWEVQDKPSISSGYPVISDVYWLVD